METTTPSAHGDWLSRYIWAVNEHALSTPSGRLALVIKAYTSRRPDGMVIDRSVGQY